MKTITAGLGALLGQLAEGDVQPNRQLGAISQTRLSIVNARARGARTPA